MEDVLLIEESGGIARVTLNRPQRLNAMDRALVAALGGYVRGLARRHDIRVVILQGAGANFCAGLDVKDQQRQPSGAEDMMSTQHGIRDIMLGLRRCPQPVIAVVQGAASGGGFALALACDIRLGTPDARMNAAFIRIGLTGCDMGVSYFLPRMVGASVASEYLLTGRFIDARRALATGLFSQVGPLENMRDEAESLARDMLRTTPMGLRLTKEAIGLAVDAPSLESVVAMEDRQQVLCTQSPDFHEGMAAFLEKREPRYGSQS